MEAREIYEAVKNYEAIREHLGVKLMRTDWHPEIVSSCVFWNFMDLSVVPYIDLEPVAGYKGIAYVTSSLYEEWKVSKDEFYYDAVLQSVTGNSCVMTFEEALNKLDFDLPYDLDLGESDENLSMHIITNSNICYGASQILDASAMVKVAEELNSPLFVIPSSIHECLIIPFSNLGGTEEVYDKISSVITEINRLYIDEKDWLSDHPYIFGRNKCNEWKYWCTMEEMREDLE